MNMADTLTEFEPASCLQALFGAPLRVDAVGGSALGGVLGVCTNCELIEVNEDPIGDIAQSVGPSGDRELGVVVSKLLAAPGQRAVGVLNPTDEPREVTVEFDRLRGEDGGPGGLEDVSRIRDLCSQEDAIGSLWRLTGRFTLLVPARGLRVLKIWGTSRPRSLA